jgi:hypothetical protein
MRDQTMPNDNDNDNKPNASGAPSTGQNQPGATEQSGAQGEKPGKRTDPNAAVKLARQEELTKQWGLDGKTTNLTRDSIIGTTRAKLIEQGKSEGEATKLAVKRGYEMVPE